MACVATWTRPRAQAILRTLGGRPRGGYCDRRAMSVSTIKTIGPNWRTDRGLWAGDEQAELNARYPAWFAAFDRPLTVGLRSFRTVNFMGDRVTVAGAYARVVWGTVRSFYFPVGGEGE